MFPFGFVIPVTLVMLFSVAAALFGLIGGGTLAFAWVITFAILIGALLVIDGHGGLRRIGAGILAAATLGLALVVSIHPAAAQVVASIAAPPGDALGLWAGINGYLADGLGTIITAAVGWACTWFVAHTRIKVRADQEAQLRETMKTGVFGAVHDLELAIDERWTPAQRQKVVEKVVAWAEIRAAAQLKKLGLPDFVTRAIASKVVAGVLAEHGGADSFDPIDAAVTGSAPYTGNPGETPALDRVVGAGGN